MPCMCGATDCPSCGPAQGYRVVRHPSRGWINLETPEDEEAYERAMEEYEEERAERRRDERERDE